MAHFWRKPWLVVLTVTCSAALLVSTASTRLVDPMLSALERTGYPGNFEAMVNAWPPPVPDEENTARIILDALDAFEPGSRDPRWMRRAERSLVGDTRRWTTDNPEVLQSVRDYLAANEAALSLLLQPYDPGRARFSQLVGCDLLYYDSDLQDIGVRINGLSRLLNWNMKDSLLRGDQELAARSLAASWRLYHAQEQDLCSLSILDWSTTMTLAIQSTYYLLRQSEPDEEILARLAETLGKSRKSAILYSIRKSLAKRPGQLAQTAREGLPYDSFLSTSSGMFPNLFIAGTGAIDRIAYAQIRIREAQTIEQSIHWAPRLRPRSGNDLHAWSAVAIFPGLDSTLSITDLLPRDVANLDLLLGIVAIERFRLRTDEYPDSLDVLVPDFLNAVPRDLYHENRKRADAARAAFEAHHGRSPRALEELARWAHDFETDAPAIQYRLEPEGYIVYSTGRNETDHGGVKHPRDNDPEDLVYRDLVREMPRR